MARSYDWGTIYSGKFAGQYLLADATGDACVLGFGADTAHAHQGPFPPDKIELGQRLSSLRIQIPDVRIASGTLQQPFRRSATLYW